MLIRSERWFRMCGYIARILRWWANVNSRRALFQLAVFSGFLASSTANAFDVEPDHPETGTVGYTVPEDLKRKLVRRATGANPRWNKQDQIELVDGRRFTLPYAAIPGRNGAEDVAFFQDEARSIVTQTLARSSWHVLTAPDAAPDRYGALPAVLLSEQEAKPLTAFLLHEGAMWVEPSAQAPRLGKGDAGKGWHLFVKGLLEAEAEARARGLGLWRFAAFRPRRADGAWPRKFTNDINRFTLVEGRLLSLGETKRYTYLNFGSRWREDYTVRIQSRDRGRIEAFLGAPLTALTGQRIRTRGWITEKDGPDMKLTSGLWIEVVP
ncbi:MAG: hypothetical protein AAGF15_03720 [Pseudomonadota bacterium]